MPWLSSFIDTGAGQINTKKDYYSILGVLPSVDEAALSAVYRALLKKYHPDVFRGSKGQAEERTREIIEAYGVLGNTESRLAYDRARKVGGDGDDYPNTGHEAEAGYEPYVSEKWTDVNKIHAQSLAKARRQVLIVAPFVAAGIIALALVGQKYNPTPATAPAEGPLATPTASIGECSTEPGNGTILSLSSGSSGSNNFEFVNKRSGNAIVKIRDATSGSVVVSFFVAAISKASFNRLPDGRFRIQYALGGNLARDCRSFVHAYAIYEIPQAETFAQKRDPQGTVYHEKLTYTLLTEASVTGNSRPTPIDAARFKAN